MAAQAVHIGSTCSSLSRAALFPPIPASLGLAQRSLPMQENLNRMTYITVEQRDPLSRRLLVGSYSRTDPRMIGGRACRIPIDSKSYARLQTKKGAHLPLIIVRKIPDQFTSAVHAWLAVRRPHATTPGDDGLSMASGGTRQVPTTAMTGGMSSDMLRHATSPAADGGYA